MYEFRCRVCQQPSFSASAETERPCIHCGAYGAIAIVAPRPWPPAGSIRRGGRGFNRRPKDPADLH